MWKSIHIKNIITKIGVYKKWITEKNYQHNFLINIFHINLPTYQHKFVNNYCFSSIEIISSTIPLRGEFLLMSSPILLIA